jgi:predicted alpha/beta-hydrolase family hydrolase
VKELIVQNLIKRWRIRSWIRLAFITWAIFVMSWLANSVRTSGVDESTLLSDSSALVQQDSTSLSFLPSDTKSHTALVFFCGSGIAADAYAPLLRPIAESGIAVFIIKLPYRFAPFESHKEAALVRARTMISTHSKVKNWAIAGHSLGGALATRMARTDSANLSALILIATTHPKNDDLSFLRIPVTKIYGSRDSIAPKEQIIRNSALLPSQTKWVEIVGGNHSQFGRYGRQLFDGTPGISREQQEESTRTAILQTLADL